MGKNMSQFSKNVSISSNIIEMVGKDYELKQISLLSKIVM
jgi:hypothetical protein